MTPVQPQDGARSTQKDAPATSRRRPSNIRMTPTQLRPTPVHRQGGACSIQSGAQIGRRTTPAQHEDDARSIQNHRNGGATIAYARGPTCWIAGLKSLPKYAHIFAPPAMVTRCSRFTKQQHAHHTQHSATCRTLQELRQRRASARTSCLHPKARNADARVEAETHGA